VTEPDYTVAKKTFKARVINTLTGSLIASLAIVCFGAGLTSLLVALGVSVLIVTTLPNYPTNWRLAPATVVILMSAAIKGASVHDELQLSMMRVGEVLYGSLVALLLSLLYTRLAHRWFDRDADADPAPAGREEPAPAPQAASARPTNAGAAPAPSSAAHDHTAHHPLD
jgi:uncharacterized membrane protein YccC